MPDTKGFMEDGSFHLRKTYKYNDTEDMEEFEGIMLDEDLCVTVEFHEDHVTAVFSPGW